MLSLQKAKLPFVHPQAQISRNDMDMLKIQIERDSSLFCWTLTHEQEFSAFAKELREFLMLSDDKINNWVLG